MRSPRRLLRDLGWPSFIVFHLLDNAERNLAVKGVVEFVDLETGERVVGDAGKIRKAYTDKLEQSLAYYKRQCLKEDVDYVLIDTSQPLDGALQGIVQLLHPSRRRLLKAPKFVVLDRRLQ